MIKNYLLVLCLVFSASAQAGGVRVKCEGDALDALVYINGKPEGNCPITLKVPGGNIKLRVTKALDEEHDGVFEKEFFLGESALKDVEITLAPQLTMLGKQKAAEREAVVQAKLAAEHQAEAEWRQRASGAAKAAVQELEATMVSIPGKPWKIMKYEVTFDQWDACVAGEGCKGYKPGDEGWGRGNRPVINVSYADIQHYIKWLNTTGKKFRLPTEEEWEYAAHGGTNTEYWWGDEIDCSQARYEHGTDGDCQHMFGKEDVGTVPVGSFKANPYGLYDTAGNVREWTTSCYETDRCDVHVVRGGSWDSGAVYVRVSDRFGSGEEGRGDYYGFRLVQNP